MSRPSGNVNIAVVIGCDDAVTSGAGVAVAVDGDDDNTKLLTLLTVSVFLSVVAVVATEKAVASLPPAEVVDESILHSDDSSLKYRLPSSFVYFNPLGLLDMFVTGSQFFFCVCVLEFTLFCSFNAVC